MKLTTKNFTTKSDRIQIHNSKKDLSIVIEANENIDSLGGSDSISFIGKGESTRLSSDRYSAGFINRGRLTMRNGADTIRSEVKNELDDGIGLLNVGVLDMGAGNDSVNLYGDYCGLFLASKSSFLLGADNDSLVSRGSYNGIILRNTSLLDTGSGNDKIEASANYDGIILQNTSRLDTGSGNDKIEASANYGYAIYNESRIDTGVGNDVITAINKNDLDNFDDDMGGIYNSGGIYTASGNDQILADDITNGGMIDTGAGDDRIIGKTIVGDGRITLGDGNDSIRAESYGDILLFGGNGSDKMLGLWGTFQFTRTGATTFRINEVGYSGGFSATDFESFCDPWGSEKINSSQLYSLLAQGQSLLVDF